MFLKQSFKISIIIILIGIVFSVFIIFFPDLSQAAKEAVEGKFFKEPNISKWVNALYLWSSGIIGVLAAATLIFAGIQYMSSVGNEEMIKQAKTKIAAGLAGLLLVLLSYTILHTLDPRLTKVGFEVEKLELKGADIKTLKMKVASIQMETTAENAGQAQDNCKKECGNKKVLSAAKGEGNKWICECEGSTTTDITADSTYKAEEQCQMSCPSGSPYIKELGNGKFQCECAGGEIEPICEDDEDCEKLCLQILAESECKKKLLYCREDKKCDLSKEKNIDEKGNLIGKKDGKSCSKDWECQSGLCLIYQGYICGKPLDKGSSCKRDIECQSGICGYYLINECAPIGGLPYNSACDSDAECTSKNCVTEGINECARVGGNLYNEDCDDNSDCEKNAGMWCDDGDCVCAKGLKWNPKTQKCE